MKRAALYARISTSEQNLETQLLDLRQMAKHRDHEIIREYTDTISGSKSKRPGLDQLLADARRHRFDIVLVSAFDRVARNVRHFLEVLDELNHLGIEFVTFENAFGQMIKFGCKWEILLTCITCYHTYNARRRVAVPARYDSEGELLHLPEKDWEPDMAPRPPGRDERNRIATNLKAAAGEIENHEDLLSTLGRLNPPPQTEWADPATDGDMRDVRITAEEAILYVQKLLGWCRKLLSDDSIGNFSTVESVGQLVPCVYVEVVAPRAKSGKGQRLPLQNVADLLNAVRPQFHHSQGQLRIALDRFTSEYPRLHSELMAKIEELHRTSNEHADGWRHLFAVEDRLRSR